MFHLANSSEWRDKVVEEQNMILNKYNIEITNNNINDLEYNLPLEAFDEMKCLDIVLNEVLRLTLSGTVMRRQLKDYPLNQGQYKLPVGSFAVHMLGSTHLDPKIWKDPNNFDPSRFVDCDYSSNAQFPFLGFGVGQHPCLGMRFARLEIKMICSVLLNLFDWKVQNTSTKLPTPNRNNLHTLSPDNIDSVMLICKRRI